MPFKPEPGLPDFDALRAILNISKAQTENNPLYQTILELLERTQRMQTIFNNRLQNVEARDEVDADAVMESGYWTPLILSTEPGDSELILTDADAPIAVFTPTPD